MTTSSGRKYFYVTEPLIRLTITTLTKDEISVAIVDILLLYYNNEGVVLVGGVGRGYKWLRTAPTTPHSMRCYSTY